MVVSRVRVWGGACDEFDPNVGSPCSEESQATVSSESCTASEENIPVCCVSLDWIEETGNQCSPMEIRTTSLCVGMPISYARLNTPNNLNSPFRSVMGGLQVEYLDSGILPTYPSPKLYPLTLTGSPYYSPIEGLLSPTDESDGAYRFRFTIDKDFEVSAYEIKYDEKFNFYESDIPDSEKNVDMRLLDRNGAVTYAREMPLHYFIYDVPGEQDVASVQVQLPYSTQDSELQLLNDELVLLSVDLNAEFCNGNGVCDGSENYYICPSDCKVNADDDTCITFEDGLCDEDCYYDGDCKEEEIKLGLKKGASSMVFVIVGFSILLILIIIAFWVVLSRSD